MNAALLDVFLVNLPKAIRKTYKPICMKEPNMVFLHMFHWLFVKYGNIMTKDCKENQQRTSSAAEYAHYIHQSLCSLSAATLLTALNRSNELTTIPGLNPS
jgi:hypothetical protein